MNSIKYLQGIFLLLLLSNSTLFAQGPKDIEKNLMVDYMRLQYCISHFGGDERDSIYVADTTFKSELICYTSIYPSTSDHNFNALREKGFRMARSTDGIFKIYSWDNGMAISSRLYDDVYQYKNGSKVYSGLMSDTYISDDDKNTGSWYNDTIYTLNANNRTYYLAIYHTNVTNKACTVGIKVLAMGNNKLNDTVALIKTGSGMHNKIEYWYVPGTSDNEKSDGQIHYDVITKTIYIPLLLDDNTNSGKYIEYRFNGRYFEKVSK